MCIIGCSRTSEFTADTPRTPKIMNLSEDIGHETPHFGTLGRAPRLEQPETPLGRDGSRGIVMVHLLCDALKPCDRYAVPLLD